MNDSDANLMKCVFLFVPIRNELAIPLLPKVDEFQTKFIMTTAAQFECLKFTEATTEKSGSL